MKVLQINSCYGVYSTGKIAADISTVLKNSGHECINIFGRYGKPDTDAFNFNSRLDIYRHTLLSRLFDKEGLYSAGATRKIIKKIEEFSPDIIHLHNIHGHYLNYKMLFEYINKNNIPVVWTLHDCWTMTGHCASFESVSCKKWITNCGNCPQKRSYPESFFWDNSEKNHKLKKELFGSVKKMVLVTPSEWLKEYVDKSFMGACKTVVIHNGIDTKIFKKTDSDLAKRFGLSGKKVVLGVASSWTKAKGLDDFIALSKILPAEYKVVLIGLTEKQIKGLPDNILGISKTKNQEELAKWYSLASVFVNPTYEDNFPTVNLEAQCCETPVVTYKTGGSPETVADGCGIVLKRGDVAGLKNAAEQAAATEITKDLTSVFDKTVCFNKYISIYEDILSTER